MQFCPTCGNVLLVNGDQSYRFFCQTCPYVHEIARPVKRKIVLQRKEVDDVLGGAEAWANVDQTDALCPKCANDRAYFMQIQTRSADEPMTTFYRCANFECQNNWKEG
jgi:DNA-directed RNA polymerase III subunit RPC11